MTSLPHTAAHAPEEARLPAALEDLPPGPVAAGDPDTGASTRAERWLAEAVSHPPTPATPLLDPESLAAAVVGPDGRLIAATTAFHADAWEMILEPDAFAKAAVTSEPVVRAVSIVREDLAMPGLVAYGSARASRSWYLTEPVRAGLNAPGAVAVIASSAPRGAPLTRATQAFGLTGLQARLCSAIIATGDIRSAAGQCAVSYATAREAVSAAMERMGVRKLPQLVTEIARLAYGVLPAASGEALLTDLWGLSLRQATLASLVAGGLTRQAAASALGVSAAVAKKELEAVYQALSVRTAGQLARSLAAMAAIAAMLSASGGSVGALDTQAEPLRFTLRPDGSRIAYSDYGPASGAPVLLVHSSVTTRIASRSLVAALKGAGWRPISIDRPGFGLSDMVTGRDPFEAAAQDMVWLADALGVRRWSVLARGGAQAMVALQRTAPERLGRVVLVNPDPPTAAEGRRYGPLGVFKDLYWRSPHLIEAGARLMSGQLTLPRLHRMLARSVAGSPPDEAALLTPGLVEDYHRAVRPFATGRVAGCVAEQRWLAHPPADAQVPVHGAGDWRVLVAGHDTLHDPAQVLSYWQALLPEARFQLLPDDGRLVALARPEAVIAALRAA